MEYQSTSDCHHLSSSSSTPHDTIALVEASHVATVDEPEANHLIDASHSVEVEKEVEGIANLRQVAY